jgi:uracil-DNA glycosylase
MDVQIEASWKKELHGEFNKEYFKKITEFLKEEKKVGKVIYPAGGNIFNAFAHTPFDKVKVVILGQDPYHNPGQAHGLSFSVPDGIAPPPSLVNIFKEIREDLGMEIAGKSGNLEKWANQGVLLLNASLTVEANNANSHSNAGWYQFTDAVISHISKDKEHIVFMLWGKFAQAKQNLIDGSKHLILQAAHPSPFSAYNGFFGSHHFSKANNYLKEHGEQPIDWSLA